MKYWWGLPFICMVLLRFLPSNNGMLVRESRMRNTANLGHKEAGWHRRLSFVWISANIKAHCDPLKRGCRERRLFRPAEEEKTDSIRYTGRYIILFRTWYV